MMKESLICSVCVCVTKIYGKSSVLSKASIVHGIYNQTFRITLICIMWVDTSLRALMYNQAKTGREYKIRYLSIAPLLLHVTFFFFFVIFKFVYQKYAIGMSCFTHHTARNMVCIQTKPNKVLTQNHCLEYEDVATTVNSRKVKRFKHKKSSTFDLKKSGLQRVHVSWFGVPGR